jgi:hypothetical protein
MQQVLGAIFFSIIGVCGLMACATSESAQMEVDKAIAHEDEKVRSFVKYLRQSGREVEVSDIPLIKQMIKQKISDEQRYKQICSKESNPDICIENLRHMKAMEEAENERTFPMNCMTTRLGRTNYTDCY